MQQAARAKKALPKKNDSIVKVPMCSYQAIPKKLVHPFRKDPACFGNFPFPRGASPPFSVKAGSVCRSASQRVWQISSLDFRPVTNQVEVVWASGCTTLHRWGRFPYGFWEGGFQGCIGLLVGVSMECPSARPQMMILGCTCVCRIPYKNRPP